MPKALAWLSCAVLALVAVTAAVTAMEQTADLHIDASSSRIVIDVGKTGVFGFAGHTHEIIAPAVRGRIEFDAADWQRSTVFLEFQSAALRVSPAGEPPADVPQVQQAMIGERVLDVNRFPTVTFRSRRVSLISRSPNGADVQVEGDLTLHGVTRPMTIRATSALDASGVLTTSGTFTLRQTDFNIQPVTAAAGSVRVKDAVEVHFVLKARS